MAPTSKGIIVGVGLPWMVVAPALVWGDFLQMLYYHGAYELLPIFSLLAIPAAFAGMLAAQFYPTRRDTWHFGIGLFLGGSLAGAELLWAGGVIYEPLHRLVYAAFGGPLLIGFWEWIGALLGTTTAYAKAERKDPEPRPDVP